MMGRRINLASVLFSILFLVLTSAVNAQDSPLVRIRDLNSHLQMVVTVQGRTGYIAEHYENKGRHVFTLRDDYNDQVLVRTPAKDYPTMGTTYRVTGWATKENGTLFIDTLTGHVIPVYPTTPTAAPAPSPASKALLWVPTALSALIVLFLLGYALRRWQRRLQPEWGELIVTSGPDRGMTVPLRRHQLFLGRGVNPARDVRLSSGDQTISNRHLRIVYKRGELFVKDMSSNGTRIGGEKLMPEIPVKVISGDLIHIGTRGTVIIIRLLAVAPSQGLLGRMREPSPVADRTIILPEPVEEPAWMRPTSEATHAQGVAQPGVEHAVDTISQEEGEQALAGNAPMEKTANLHTDTEVAGGDEEEDIPHTHLPPLVFSFTGHEPHTGRFLSDDAAESTKNADDEAASA